MCFWPQFFWLCELVHFTWLSIMHQNSIYYNYSVKGRDRARRISVYRCKKKGKTAMPDNQQRKRIHTASDKRTLFMRCNFQLRRGDKVALCFCIHIFRFRCKRPVCFLSHNFFFFSFALHWWCCSWSNMISVRLLHCYSTWFVRSSLFTGNIVSISDTVKRSQIESLDSSDRPIYQPSISYWGACSYACE